MIDCFIGNARTFLLAASQFFSCVHTKTVSSWYNISYGTITSNKLNIHDSIEWLNSEWVSFLFKTTYRWLVCNGVTIFGYGNYWGQMARLGITGGFSVVPIFHFREDLAQMLSATGKPITVYPAGVSWKKKPTNKQKKTEIFLNEDIWGQTLHAALNRTPKKDVYTIWAV